jgi:hypothetical protein
VIRRLLVAAAVVVGSIALFGGTASAAQDIACLYNHDPLHIGLCIAV